jgi:outer membrane protein OmpA-like peptidoglycan-associated protein
MKTNTLTFLLLLIPFLLFCQSKKQEKVAEMLFHYDVNSFKLDADELSKLDSFVEDVNARERFVVISSGTDSVGNIVNNQKLSENRSKTVMDYLLKKGFAKAKIKIINYGESSPTADNSSEEGRRNNRYSRVELFEEKINLEKHIRISATLKDDETKLPIVDSMVLVFHQENPDTFYSDKKGNLQIIVPDSVKAVDIFIKDYFFVTVRVDKDKNRDLKIQLPGKKAKIGNKINFNDIIFIGNQAIMVTGSYKTCDKITRFLKYNPKRSVEIAGHVNVPNSSKVSVGSEEYVLSVQRAKRVCEYLTDKGISEERLIAKGYGNWQMLYPKAITEEEQQKNRRVEVRIIK